MDCQKRHNSCSLPCEPNTSSDDYVWRNRALLLATKFPVIEPKPGLTKRRFDRAATNELAAESALLGLICFLVRMKTILF